MIKNIVIVALTVSTLIAGATLLVQSKTEWQSEVAVQIAARRLDDGRVEFGLQKRQGDGYSDLILPDQRFLAADAEVDEWKVTEEIAIPTASVVVRLRDGVYAGDYLDEFVVYLDGEVYETNCSELRLDIVGSSVLFETQDEECSEWVGLATACGSADANCDVQQASVYLWEAAQRSLYGFEEIEVSIDDAQAIVDAIYSDYVGSDKAPPAVVARTKSTVSDYSAGDHTISLSTWGRDLDTVLHEVTHAIVDASRRAGDLHGPHYAAQILDVWSRYAPIIDTAAAKLAASDSGVEVAGIAPVHARSSSGVDVIWSLICTEPVRSEPYCDALSGAMRTPVQPLAVAGVFDPVIASDFIGHRRPAGVIGDYRWFSSRYEEDGTVRTQVVSEDTIDELPDRVARLNIKCEEDELRAQVWWQIDRGFSTSVLIRFGDDEFERQVWTRGEGTWTVNEVSDEFRVANVSNDEQFIKELMWAASAGENFTMQIRSGPDPLTATFDLDGLFETPVQPNLARCGR